MLANFFVKKLDTVDKDSLIDLLIEGIFTIIIKKKSFNVKIILKLYFKQLKKFVNKHCVFETRVSNKIKKLVNLLY